MDGDLDFDDDDDDDDAIGYDDAEEDYNDCVVSAMIVSVKIMGMAIQMGMSVNMRRDKRDSSKHRNNGNVFSWVGWRWEQVLNMTIMATMILLRCESKQGYS